MSNGRRPPLYKHQEETIQFLMPRKASAVLSEQGTGKTRSVIEFVNRKFPDGGFRGLVICPATIIGVWDDEIAKYGDELRTHLLVGTKKKRLKLLNGFSPGWYIINYEGLRSLRKANNLAKLPWDIVVADEMTRIKNPAAKQSKAVHDFADLRPNAIRIGLTGTPVTQSPLDVYSQFRFVDPRLFGGKWFSFKNRYATFERRFVGGHSFQEICGFKNLEEIKKKIYQVSIRHTKKDCLDLPEKIYQRVSLDWNPESKTFYDELAKDLIADLNGEVFAVGNALAKLAKLRQVCNGFIYKEGGVVSELPGKPEKIRALLSLIEDTPGQLIVWACFREDIRKISKALEKESISFVEVSGNRTFEERSEAIEIFQSGARKVVIAQCGVAQYGVTLTAAETSIFYSQNFSVEERMQAEDRNHRIGTTSPVRYIDLIMRDSVDKSIAETLKRKKKLASSITSMEVKNLIVGEV